MMTEPRPDTEQLLRAAADGDSIARSQLLRRHRDRLRRMVAMHIDGRLKARFDPSDVIQEALITASSRLPSYLETRPIPFYPWLRKIAWEHLVKLQKKHLHATRRTVKAEHVPTINDESELVLVERLAGTITGPSEKMMREELRGRVQQAIRALRPRDREILELLYLEQLTSTDAAAVLEISSSTVRTRHFRAIRRLSQLLEEPPSSQN